MSNQKALNAAAKAMATAARGRKDPFATEQMRLRHADSTLQWMARDLFEAPHGKAARNAVDQALMVYREAVMIRTGHDVLAPKPQPAQHQDAGQAEQEIQRGLDQDSYNK